MNNEVKTRGANEIRGASFVIWLSSFIRHSSFVIRHFSDAH
jgi:hypothetical protein